MVCLNPGLPHKQAASAHKFFVAMCPDIEVLMCFISCYGDVQAFDDAPPLCCSKQQGSEIDLGERHSTL